MPTRQVQRRRLKKYAIGDMRERITIHVRTATAPAFNTASMSEDYDDGTPVWAAVMTLDFANSGQNIFDSVNLQTAPSHKMVIRYRNDITAENIIRWRDNEYKILRIINPEERNQYLEMFVNLKGDEDFAANN